METPTAHLNHFLLRMYGVVTRWLKCDILQDILQISGATTVFMLEVYSSIFASLSDFLPFFCQFVGFFGGWISTSPCYCTPVVNARFLQSGLIETFLIETFFSLSRARSSALFGENVLYTPRTSTYESCKLFSHLQDSGICVTFL